MSGVSLFPVFLVGLAGSVHCVGMCGGIVGALSLPRPRQPTPALREPAFPVPVRSSTASASLTWIGAYNAGRIASYMTAGALAGGLAGSAASLASLPALQAGFYWAANLMLVALGLFLMDAWRGLARVEQAGQALWRHLAPLLRRVNGARAGGGRMFALGALWGWLPCGMVYSVLVTAMLSGSALGGAGVMLAFGLGTLPMLAALGLAGGRLRTLMARRTVRLCCALAILVFGILGLARAAGGLPAGWMHELCLGSPA
ncbi:MULTISPECIES: sulfite exporter TauE/SafE family protein [Massilia]|uniref:Cytochrome biogenesis protein n=1 Tax=Massilia aurea TaxID=373040 RepID=A0A422QMC6_9BURK|nr:MULTISPECIES: sulfite exporter TauE/SafE family protein [Massilia]MDY0960780.1 sulfite exporter TauE/SafE family protein [Massilia sp. CFBP9026]RNF31136.1 cytochrome biogenesis protein [Massilia aurea]